MVKAKNKEYKLIKPKKYKETLEYKNNELKINELNNFFTKDNTNNKIYYPYKIKNNLWGGSRIEPIEYDKMIKNKFPLPNKYVRGCLVGTSGSGKSYLLTSLIDCLPHIECAVIASKLYNNKYHGAICSYLNDHQIPAYLVHDPYEVMEKIEYMVNNYKNEKLIIFDDFDNKSKNKDEIYNKIKNISFSMLRNYKCHMFNVRAVRKVLLSPSPKTYISELDKYVGNSHEGGYLAGVIDSTQTEGASGKRYALIVAPKASGEHNSLEWGGYNSTISGADSTWNGKQNTIDLMTDSQSHPAASFCNDLTIGGYSDWYLPAPDELELIYCSFKPTTLGNHTGTRDLYGQTNGYNPNSDPAKDGYTTSNPSQTRLSDWQDGGSEFLDDTYYWSSMKDCKTHAWNQAFSHALQISSYKDGSCKVRAVRQVIL